MQIRLTSAQIMPPDGSAILVKTRPNPVYENGEPTGRYDGIRCDLRVLPDLSAVSVKVPGAKAPISNEELETAALLGHLTWVRFDGFSGSHWLDRRTGTLRVTGTATAIHLTEPPTATDDIVM